MNKPVNVSEEALVTPVLVAEQTADTRSQAAVAGPAYIVLAGISTSMGVESTARSAWEHSYNLIFVEDAITDVDAASHAHTFGKIFPHLGEIATTEQFVGTLISRSASRTGSTVVAVGAAVR